MKKVFILGLMLILLLPTLPMAVAEDEIEDLKERQLGVPSWNGECVIIFGHYDRYKTDGDGYSKYLFSDNRTMHYWGWEYDSPAIPPYWLRSGNTYGIHYNLVIFRIGLPRGNFEPNVIYNESGTFFAIVGSFSTCKPEGT